MTPRPPLFVKTNTVNPASAATDALSSELMRTKAYGLHWAASNWTTFDRDVADQLFAGLVVPDSDDVDLHWDMVDAVDRCIRPLGGWEIR